MFDTGYTVTVQTLDENSESVVVTVTIDLKGLLFYTHVSPRRGYHQCGLAKNRTLPGLLPSRVLLGPAYTDTTYKTSLSSIY